MNLARQIRYRGIALLRLTRVARPGSLIFLISDFRRLGADAERHLRELAGHCDLVLVHVFDPVEAELPPPGRYRVVSGGRTLSIETCGARQDTIAVRADQFNVSAEPAPGGQPAQIKAEHGRCLSGAHK